MFTGIYTSLWLQLRRLASRPKRTFFFAFLLFVLVRGLADTDAFDLSLPLWSIVLISMLANHEDSTNHGFAAVPSLARPHPLGPVQRV
jgi:hypothetical protein